MGSCSNSYLLVVSITFNSKNHLKIGDYPILNWVFHGSFALGMVRFQQKLAHQIWGILVSTGGLRVLNPLPLDLL